MFLEIITPDKMVFKGEIKSIKVPGSDGSFSVLNKHASIISNLEWSEFVNTISRAQNFLCKSEEIVEEKLSDKKGIEEKNIGEIKETNIVDTEIDSEEKPEASFY